ncbi:MAG: hypothetical protein DDG60_16590 [Anaerolineae bacterium]|nr:MAG: hypothetical protein DDG60_16590 [Anaerolineae bacterium]
MKFAHIDPRKEPERAEHLWRSMLEHCPHHYFLSWGWVSTWLSSLPTKQDIRLLIGFSNEEPVLAFFAGMSQRKNFFHPWRIVALNATANPYFDKIYQEYNTALTHPSLHLDFSVFQQACRTLGWDELYLPAISAQFAAQLGNPQEHPQKHRMVVQETMPSYSVNLAQIREQNMDYAGLLSANKRAQIRRSIKEYEKGGRVEVQEAQNAQEALFFLEKLKYYHEKEWKERGQDGAFSNEFFCRFHQALITQRFAQGEIQLLRISTPAVELGYLYNFIYRGRVYFYQSGFHYLPGNLYRPGLVSHYYAIVRNAQLGYQTYDFMAGEAEYKKSLSTDSERMYWLRLFRSTLGFTAWNLFTAAKQAAKRSPLVYRFMKRLKKLAF